MALNVDIRSNNAFEKQALATAAALDKIAVSEKQVNALADKLGVTSKQVGAAQKHIADARKKADKETLDAGKQKKAGEAEFRDKIKAGAAAWYLFKDAVAATKDTVVDLAKTVLEASFNASQTKREASAMIGAFTGGRAAEFMASLDVLAAKLGNTVDDTRAQFVQFRETGASSQMAFNLIKARADMIALGLSAKMADAQIAYVTASGRDMGMAFARLRDIQAHIKGVGDGATATAYALTSVTAAESQIKSAVSEQLAKLWDQISPDIGAAAHRLADFATELIKSKEGQAVIATVVDTFKSMAKAIDKEAIAKAIEQIKDMAEAGLSVKRAFGQVIDTVDALFKKLTGGTSIFKGIAAVFNGKIGEGIAGYIEAQDAVTENAAALNAKRAELAGGAIGQGLAKGIAESAGAAADASQAMADDALRATAAKLEIRSPSKAFARMGKQTVAGFEQGQATELAGEMPIDRAVARSAEKAQAEVARDDAPAPQPAQRTQAGQAGPPGRDGVNGSAKGVVVTIENLIVQGGGTAEENARSVRQELQLLLTAGNLSRGVSSV